MVRKERPEWQKGKFNGIGGHVEENETADQAMVREYKEESGVRTEISDWIQFATINGPDFYISAYICVNQKIFQKTLEWETLRSKDEDEELYPVEVSALTHNIVVPNVLEMVHFCISPDFEHYYKTMRITYQE